MLINKVMLKRILIFGLILLLGATINACSPAMSWKEEVRLSDGRILIVSSHLNLGGYPTLDARERAPLDKSITFTLPDSNKTISWKTEFNDRVPEPNSLSPLLLDVVGGIPYLATSPAGCISYNKWGRPNPPYVLYKYVNNEWMRIPLKEFPAVLVQENLIGRPASSLLKPYYNLEAAKAEREDGNVSDYAKTILREAMVRERCPQYSSGPGAPIPITPSTSPK